MAEKVKPVYYDESVKSHKPMADGVEIDASVIPVSTDEGNALTTGTDGGLMVPEQSTDGLIAKGRDNYIERDQSGGLYVDGNSVLSNGEENLLKINETDKKILLTKQDMYDGFFNNIKAGQGIAVDTAVPGEATVSTSIAPNRGLAYDESGRLYINLKGMSKEDLEALLRELIYEGGGLSVDDSGKLYVDFSLMPEDKLNELLKSIRVPILLTQNIDFYVNGTSGSDTLETGRGMSKEKPFKTIQACVSYVSDNYNLSRFYATINVTAGTYNEAVTVGQLNATTGGMIIKKQAEEAGEVQIKKVKTKAGNLSTFTKSGTGNIQLHELTIEMESNNELPDAGSSGDAFAVNVSGGVVRLYNCTCIYRATKGFHRSPAIFFASDTGQIHINTGNTMKSVFTAGDKPIGFFAKPGGSIALDNMDANTPDKNKCTISGDYSIFASIDGGTFTRAGTTKPTLAADGPVTGKRYRVTSGGRCNTGGGANYFPGSEDGTVDATTFSWYK